MKDARHNPETRWRYPVLSWYSGNAIGVAKLILVLLAAVALVVVVAAIAASKPADRLGAGLAALLGMALWSPGVLLLLFYWVVGAELVRVFLDIENNGAQVAKAVNADAKRRAAKQQHQQAR